MRVRIYVLVALTLLAGCASRPEMSSYPRAQIERPYTLPSGVATWETWVPMGSIKNSSQTSTLAPIPIPLFWDMALSDDWTLHWSPLPLSASHQIYRSSEQLWGVSFGIAGGYASDRGVLLAPQVSGYQRQTVSEGVAFETVPQFTAGYESEAGEWTWTSGVDIGPLFQLTSTFALAPKAGVRIAQGDPDRVILRDESIQPDDSLTIVVPVGISAYWSFDRQWNLDASYSFRRIGYANDYTAHLGVVKLVHYW